MTGDAGGYAQATIEIEAAEAAGGATKAVWTPQYGQVSVQIPAGTADGTVMWGHGQSGPVAVTVRVRPGQPAAPVSGMPEPAAPTQPWGAPPPHYGQQPGYPAQAGPGYPAQPGPGYPPTAFPAGPPVAPAKSKKGLLIGVGSAVVLVLIVGCCLGGRMLTSKSTPTNKVAAGPGATATHPSTGPISDADYSTLLAGVDSAIKVDFDRLNTTDVNALKAAGPAASATMRTQAAKLQAVTPPSTATAVNGDLADALTTWADTINNAGSTKAACPAGDGNYTELLRSQNAADIRVAVKDLSDTDPSFKFGTFLPAVPAEQNRRLANGTYVKQPGSRGLGHLEIINGASDTAISLVPTNSNKAVLTVYVRSKGKFTATGVKDGTYRVFSATGADWNAAKKGFTRACGFTKFDDTFKFTTTSTSSTIWRLTLTPVANGNASTSDVDPNAFPTN